MTSRRQPPIAIVGIGGLFPGSLDAGSFWNHILQMSDLVTEVPATHWRAEDYLDRDPKAPDKTYCARGAFLPPVPFDPLAVGLPPSLLPSTDTSQLLGLLVARATLEDMLRPFPGATLEQADKSRLSCILGVTSGQELFGQMAARLAHPTWKAGMRAAGIDEAAVERAAKLIGDAMVPWTEATFPGLLGNVVAGRIANRLDLGGTNAVTDAACASSFAALSMAIDELVLGRADCVLTGGVDTLNDIFMYMCFSKTPALSASGECRPFDAKADGTLLGEGLGMLALKRLEDAERDGNQIYAVIRGVGTSSDGRSKSVYAPVSEGQARAITRAYEAAGYSPRTVELVEAHGTGTKAGDVAELGGLKLAFTGAEADPDRQWCALGSVKSQIGHTKSAAGAAGLLKVALALHHKVLPPTIKVDTPNPAAKLDESPFYLNTEARPWIRSAAHPRRASVSSFGFGGSNFHVALEEYAGPAPRPARLSRRLIEVVALSARSEADLQARARALAEHLAKTADLAAFAREVNAGFDAGAAHRAAFVASTIDEARRFLDVLGTGKTAPGLFVGAGAPGAVAFVFPGQGSQSVGMGAALAMEFEAARAAFDRADDVLPLASLIFPPPSFTDDDRKARQATLTATENAQPALGAASLATLRTLEQLGVSFQMAAGHSFGELTALCAAGAFDEVTLLRLARRRGELMAGAASVPGAMAAVLGDAARIPAAIAGLDVVVANENAPDQTVLSGAAADVDEAMKRLGAAGLTVRQLGVSTAFHSPLVEAACAPLGAFLADLDVKAPRVPVFANTTAAPHDTAASIRTELSRQVRERVRFVDEVKAMHAAGARVFVEVGPGQVLTGLVSRIVPDAVAVATDGREPLKAFFQALARLCAAGVAVDLEALPEAAPSRAPLPTKTSVMITGSNVGKPTMPAPAPARAPATAALAAAPSAPSAPSVPAPTTTAPSTPSAPSARAASRAPALAAPAPAVSRLSMTTNKTAPAANSSWLDVLREGQRQTAEAHLAFQRSLTDAHAAYLAAFENTQNALVAALSGQPLPAPVTAPRAMPAPAALPPPAVAAPAPRGHGNGHGDGFMNGFTNGSTNGSAHGPNGNGHGHANGNGAHKAAVLPSPAVVTRPVAPPRPVLAPAPATRGAVAVDARGLLLDVVADKTGYPKESLDDSMSLEADLGIDSIKRVEILGALKEKLPAAGAMDALALAQLKTLGEIARALAGNAPAAAPSAPTPVASAAPAAAASSAGAASVSAGVLPVLLDVVAEKTGYPKEALSPQMALESDLGVDSIKRVEIMSALKERVPNLPAVDAVKLAQLATLGEIAGALDGAHDSAHGNGTNGAARPF